MKLTAQQRLAVRADGNTLLDACPGSGKTRAIIAKLLRCTEEVRDTTRRVACITYTNAAVDEIDERLTMYGSTDDELYCQISTIHTFCLANVLGLFHWKIPSYAEGFTVLPPDSEKYQEIALGVLDKHGLSTRSLEQFSQLNREPNGTPVLQRPLTAGAARDFWLRLEAEGYIDFPNVVYRSYQLLAQNPSLVHGLACRFAWILVDEFQDTSALQVEVLRLIANERWTRFFLVGDPFQSIYSFSGARPRLMPEFARYVNARSDYALVENFRCSKPIIRHAERLLPRPVAMYSPEGHNPHKEEPWHVRASSAFEALVDHFIPALDALNIQYGEAAVLAPT